MVCLITVCNILSKNTPQKSFCGNHFHLLEEQTYRFGQNCTWKKNEKIVQQLKSLLSQFLKAN